MYNRYKFPFDIYGWWNVAKFNEIILCVERNNYFNSTTYLYIHEITTLIQITIYILNEMIIYIFNEIIIFIQRIIYIFNKLLTFQRKNYSTNYFYIQRIIYISTKELFSLKQLNISIQQMNWSILIQPNGH